LFGFSNDLPVFIQKNILFSQFKSRVGLSSVLIKDILSFINFNNLYRAKTVLIVTEKLQERVPR